VPDPLVSCQGTVFLSRRRAQRKTVCNGEDGVKPSRCRHCKRGVILHKSHCVFRHMGRRRGTTIRESGNPADGYFHTQPFEPEGGLVCSPVIGIVIVPSCSLCAHCSVFLSYGLCPFSVKSLPKLNKSLRPEK
jgi:hypothetical protein